VAVSPFLKNGPDMLRAFEMRVLTRISGSKREEVIQDDGEN
jgi:hypothetical protein